jgi:HlyD family secretion protein
MAGGLHPRVETYDAGVRVTGRTRLLVAVALLASIVGCTEETDTGIDVGAATRGTVVEVVEAPGTVTAKASATLSAPADGTIAVLRVQDGTRVKARRVVLEINSPEAQDRLRQAQQADAQAAAAADVSVPGIDLATTAGRSDERARDAFTQAREVARGIEDKEARAAALARLAEAEADYAAARADADRTLARFNAGLASLSQALSSLASAQRVQTAAALDLAQSTVDALTVRAPIAGVVTLASASASAGTPSGLDSLGLPSGLADAASALGSGAGGSSESVGPVSVGSPVTSGQPIVTITDSSELSLAAEVDETDVLLVQPGTPAVAEFDALPGASYPAEVVSVDLAPAPSARGGVAYRVRLTLTAGETLDGQAAPPPLPGMSAIVELAVREATDVVTVPVSAVFRDATGDAVWRVEDGVARRQAVEVGAQGAEAVEIRSGLAVGDEVVVRGADVVVEGDLVSDTDGTGTPAP